MAKAEELLAAISDIENADAKTAAFEEGVRAHCKEANLDFDAVMGAMSDTIKTAAYTE